MHKILWIEDDYYCISGLMRPLERAGLQIDIATSAVEAYEKAKGWKSYDLIVTDLILPTSDGVQGIPDEVQAWAREPYCGIGLLKWLRLELRANCPILLLSVVNDPVSVYGLENLNLDGCLQKRGLLPSRVKEEVFQLIHISNASQLSSEVD